MLHVSNDRNFTIVADKDEEEEEEEDGDDDAADKEDAVLPSRDRRSSAYGVSFQSRLAELMTATMSELEHEHQRHMQRLEHDIESRLLALGHSSAVTDLRAQVATSSIIAQGEPEGEVVETMSPGSLFLATSRGSRNLITFKLLPGWSEQMEAGGHIEDTQLAQIRYNASVEHWLFRSEVGTMSSHASKKMVMLPTASRRILWDLLAALCLAYDLCVIPMAVFSIPEDGTFFILSVIEMFFWTVDIGVHFFMGYYDELGALEVRPKKVALRYLKTWLVPDLAIVAIDWMTYGPKIFTGSDSGQETGPLGLLRVGKLARFVRMMRLLRLVRIAKLQAISSRVQEMVGLESTAIIINLFKNLGLIVFINHLIACGWYWVGDLHEDSWLSDSRTRNVSHWFDKYLISLYWTLANFTPGSSGLQPVTTEEYIYTVVVLFFSLVAFTVLVSSTTSLVTRLMGISSARNHQLWILKGFLYQHKFKHELRDRVMRYVTAALGQRKELIHRSEVQLLDLLSQPLREEVQLSLHLTTLRVHPLFRILSYVSLPAMRRISAEAISEVRVSRGDVIFSNGEEIEKMGFIVSGVLHYVPMSNEEPKMTEASSNQLLGPNDFYCESVLWTQWFSRGAMQADVDSDLLELNSSAFHHCIMRQPLILGIVVDYARAFVEACYVTEGQPIVKFLNYVGVTDARPYSVGNIMTLRTGSRAR